MQCRNLSWCSLPAGLIITSALVYVWANVLYTPELSGGHGNGSVADDGSSYGFCVLLYAASVVLELLCDSLYIRCQNEMRQHVCVMVEGLAILLRAVVTVGLAIMRPDLGIIAFGLGQLAFSTTLCGSYFGYFVVHRRIPVGDLLPSRPPTTITNGNRRPQQQEVALLPPKSVPLAISLFKQSALKQFLTEGERFLMTMVANINFEAQGVYVCLHDVTHRAQPGCCWKKCGWSMCHGCRVRMHVFAECHAEP